MRKPEMIVGVDLGGTSLRALVVNRSNDILAEVKTPTQVSKKVSGVISEIAKAVKQAVKAAGLEQKQIAAVSVGAPGAVDSKSGVVHEAPNLGWRDVPLGKKLQSLVHVPVLVENDVNVGAMGEYALGAGRGAGDMVGIFVGTGIGGGIISHGELYEGSTGGAGEVGHMVVLVDGPLCGCGHRGCAEAVSSRTAMERDVRAAIKAGRASIVLDIMREKNKPRMTSSVIHSALKKKDRVMREVIERAQYYLGILVANVVNLLDPERVVIGGGIAERLGDDFVHPIRDTAREYFFRPGDVERVNVVCGSLGDNAGALGAVVLARRRLNL